MIPLPKRFFGLLVWLLMATGGKNLFAADKSLTIEADSWCPINCAATDPKPGIGIDLAKKIFEPLGYKIHYVVVPWTRALQDVRTGKVNAVVGANRNDDAHLVFPDEPIYLMTDDFYVAAGDPWKFQGGISLKKKRIGVIADYGYGDIVTQFIKDNANMADIVTHASGADALPANIQELLAHHINIVVESKPVMEYTLNKMAAEDKISWAGSTPQGPVYLAFSPALPDSKQLAKAYDAGIKRLKASGALDAMYKQYGM